MGQKRMNTVSPEGIKGPWPQTDLVDPNFSFSFVPIAHPMSRLTLGIQSIANSPDVGWSPRGPIPCWALGETVWDACGLTPGRLRCCNSQSS